MSEPGSGTYLDAEMVHGSDYVTMQPSQTHTRINVRAILRFEAFSFITLNSLINYLSRDKDGALLTYSYKGIIEIDEAFLAILTGSPDAKTTSYGKALSQIKFGTGSERHKDLENGLFVGSAHFVVENGKYFVETKISRIVG